MSAQRASRTHQRRGLTLVECLIVVVVIVVLIAVLLPSGSPSRVHARQAWDANSVKQAGMSFVTWAQNNKGYYPLPSRLDLENKTVAEEGRAKDTTGNILSVLVHDGFLATEMLVSRAESNTTQIQAMQSYEYERPSAAVVPADAIWDPAFRGTPDDSEHWGRGGPNLNGISNQSYAHVIPAGDRLAMWRDTYNANEPVFGNRGPTYAADDVGVAPAKGRWKLLAGPLGTESNTLLIHGGRRTWEGNIGYNDNHVTFETSPTTDNVRYFRTEAERKSGKGVLDNLFVKEPDELASDARPWECGKGVNAYLRPISQMKEGGTVKVWRD